MPSVRFIDPESSRSAWIGRVLWGALLLGCVLRLWNAWNTSFWLDDFHSMHHARAGDMQQFFEVLLRDNHPPLSFLLLRLADTLLGPGEWALHAPNLLVAFLGGALLWRLVGKLIAKSPLQKRVRCFALMFLCFSAMHVDLSSNLRMYALLGLCILGLLGALIDQFEEHKGQLRTVFWIALGLHSHYHFLHALALFGLVSICLVLGAERYRSRLRSVLISFGLGLIVALPWYAYGFREQLAHGLPPGGSEVSPLRLAMGLLHLLHQGVGDFGSLWRPPLLVGGALGLLLAGLGQLHLLLIAKQHARPAPAILVAAAAYLLPLWSAASAALSSRAGFESRYLVGALAPMALLAALGCFGLPQLPAWTRKACLCAGVYALLSALLLSVQLALSSGHEDYRSASAFVIEEARPGDAVLAVDSQPPLFPHGIGWAYYSKRLAGVERVLPPQLEHDQHFNLLAPERLSEFQRVHCVLRSIPKNAPLLRKLRSFFQEERTQSFGRGVFVLSFSQPRPL